MATEELVISLMRGFADEIVKKDELETHLLEIIREDPAAKILVFGDPAPYIREQLKSQGKRITKENDERIAWEGGGSIYSPGNALHISGLSGNYIYVNAPLPMETIEEHIAPLIREARLFMIE